MDVYGIGVTLHEALTGTMTFDPDTPAIARPAPELPGTDTASALVVRMLAADPLERPGVAAALAAFAHLAEDAGHLVRPAWAREADLPQPRRAPIAQPSAATPIPATSDTATVARP